jgi:GAF domain-containing protein
MGDPKRLAGGASAPDAVAGGVDAPVAVLASLTGLAAQATGVVGSALSLVRDGALRCAGAHGEPAAVLEQLQATEQQGPAVDVVREGVAISVADLRDLADRWPRLVQESPSQRVRAVATVPLRAGTDVLGALTLYDGKVRRWGDADLGVAARLADVAAWCIQQASGLERQQRTLAQLQRALDSRIVIEQAKGFIAARRNVTVDAAFALLRKHANDHNANLHAAAEAVVKLGFCP